MLMKIEAIMKGQKMLNEIRLIGRLTRDPELQTTPGGASVCKFTIATNRKYKADGITKDETTFFDCVAWGVVAQNLAKYKKKGELIFVGGRMKQESWTDKNTGQQVYKMRVVAESIQYLEKAQAAQESLYNATPAQQQAGNQYNDVQQEFNDPPF